MEPLNNRVTSRWILSQVVLTKVVYYCMKIDIRLVDQFFFQAEDGIRDVERSRGLGDVYKRQALALLGLSIA